MNHKSNGELNARKHVETFPTLSFTIFLLFDLSDLKDVFMDNHVKEGEMLY